MGGTASAGPLTMIRGDLTWDSALATNVAEYLLSPAGLRQ